METKNQDMWTPYKELQSVVDSIVTRSMTDPLKDLDNYLQKHKQNYINLLKNPPKNAQSREELKKGMTEGVNLPGMGHQILSKDLVDEAIILSDMYDLNEYQALDLLCTAQRQMSFHPGLPRGLVAVLLYYDGRKALVSTLRTLVQARAGVAWSLEVNPEVIDYITDYTDKLMEDGLINKILNLLDSMDLSKETELLQQNRAFGGPKHNRQVVDLLEGTKQILADIVYCWAVQCGLPREPTVRLIQQLRRTKLEEGSTGGIDGVTLSLQMALLCALDLSILQRREDGEDAVQLLPLMSDPDFLPVLHRELTHNSVSWECEGLQALTFLAWGLVLATIRSHHSQPTQGMLDEDDSLINSAVNLGVFDFLQRTFLENATIFKEEMYMRRLHSLVTDFIVFMPLKVKELRSRAEDAARTVQSYAQQGLEPPPNLPHHYEHLMLTISRLYREDPLNLDLVLDYWCPTESTTSSAFPYRSNSRQVSLFKFVRGSADNLSPSLYVAYMKMLCSLSSTQQAARHCYNLLKQNSPANGCVISWDHFFTSLNRYYFNLRQEPISKADTVYHRPIQPRGITPQEIQGLQAVLSLIRAVAEHDEVSRAAISENPTWSPLVVLLGLVSCSVPVILKADLLLTLAALANAPDTAAALWVSMEAAQIICTVPSTSTYQPRGVQTELEDIESPAEEFPLTRAVLKLLDVLTTWPVPRLLGVGSRSPGFYPYLSYVLHSVFLKACSRKYKQPQEKWEILHSCLNLLVKFLNQYDPEPEDFPGASVDLQGGGPSQVNPPPGFHLMIELHSKPSELLRHILDLLEEGCGYLDSYAPFPGKEALEASMLGCLQLLERALGLQQRFHILHSSLNSNLLLTGLSRLLLGLNSRTKKPDFLVSVGKYVTYNNWLPRHAFAAVHILLAVSSYPTAAGQLVDMFTSSPSLELEIRHGFVECLEAEEESSDENEPGEESGIILKTKEAILKLMQSCLNQAPPNISHYLLGFQRTKDISKTVFQQPGVMGFPRTCMHSLLAMMDTSLKSRHVQSKISPSATAQAKLLEAAYGLLYNLCAGSKTGQPVLRFLRTSNNFLARHLAALPFSGTQSAPELNQMSWLLKMVAIELKAAATRSQHSNLASLARILLSSHEEKVRSTLFEVEELPHIPDITRHSNFGDGDNKPYDRLMLKLLAILDTSAENLSTPNWEFFDPKNVEEVFSKCESTMAPGLKLVDVKKLHRILMDELSAVQGNSTVGQRQSIVEEIQTVLKYALERNKQRTHTHANVKFMDAWRQAVGVLFCVVPLEILPCPGRLQIILDTVHLLINKVLMGQMTNELANLTSSALLLLLENLRHSYVLGERPESGSSTLGHSQSMANGRPDNDCMVLAGGLVNASLSETTAQGGQGSGNGRAVLEENTAKLNVILSGILQWMLGSGVASQKLRANLYSSLLSFMHIVCLPEKTRSEDHGLNLILPDPSISMGSVTSMSFSVTGSPLRQERKTPLQASLDLVLGFGEGVVDVMCHDGTGGHDMCKMLALSCLDKLIELDPHSSWVSFLSGRGYLKHFIDSLLDSDGQLESMLHASPESLRPLYVYESKMALLCRVASTRTGAEMLLEQKALAVMASMKVFDHHPIMHAGAADSSSADFIPSVGNRYLQILLPALHLCDAVLTTLGMENLSCVVQVIHFLLSHVQTVGLVLGSASPFLPLSYLKELVHVTAVIARSANQELYSTQPDSPVPAERDRKAHLLRIQTLMLALFPHFIISEPLMRKLKGFGTSTLGDARNVEEISQNADERGEAVLYVLQVAAHLLLYARNLAGQTAPDQRNVQPLFRPSMATQHTQSVGDYSSRSIGLTGSGERVSEAQPALGVVVEQLVASVAHYQSQRRELEMLTRKPSSFSELNPMELQDILPDGMSALEQRAFTVQQLKTQMQRKERELALTSYIIDNCLYLVWLHLDFYLHRGLPHPRSGINLDSSLVHVMGVPVNSAWPVSREDISLMKQSLVSKFNDSFSKDLVDTKKNQSDIEKGFIEALLRRIKRLLQFVPVK